ncbi:MAG: amidohydrolase/deacetylase family metallohydrolase [Acidobacteria bacterium]|nr:MAG: amidohydrolase/deacetylase family metallohydrolase [Acidobacteriota bacterium]
MIRKATLLLFCWFWTIPALAQFDLLLKGGHLIDPKNNINQRMDLAILDGKVAAVAPNLEATLARRAIDLKGLYVTPGLVDLHTHLFNTPGLAGVWAGDSSVSADAFSFRTGVTTMVDAGSAGWRNFEYFRHSVIDRARTRVLALINIVGFGMINDFAEQDKNDMKPEEVARLAQKHKDIVVGVKSAHYQGTDWTSVDRAIEAGKLARIPVMVDFGYFLPERPYWKLVTERLRPGDISTHMFRGPVPYVDETGKLYPYLRQAQARGVKFDVGHGGGSFVMRNALPAIQQGFYPDSISTDLHAGSMNAGMMDMPTTMSKLLVMGMPLQEVILRSTWNPAQIIHRPDLGHLGVGATADLSVWNLMEGDFGFADASGGKIQGNRRLFCELTLKDGRIAWDWNARGAVDYKTLEPMYGIRKGIDHIVRPR